LPELFDTLVALPAVSRGRPGFFATMRWRSTARDHPLKGFFELSGAHSSDNCSSYGVFLAFS
jgi:hypothetical protein